MVVRTLPLPAASPKPVLLAFPLPSSTPRSPLSRLRPIFHRPTILDYHQSPHHLHYHQTHRGQTRLHIPHKFIQHPANDGTQQDSRTQRQARTTRRAPRIFFAVQIVKQGGDRGGYNAGGETFDDAGPDQDRYDVPVAKTGVDLPVRLRPRM